MVLRFIPHAILDGWMDEGRVDVRPDQLIDLATRTEFPLREAVRFVKVESGADVKGWVNRVKSVEEIRALGAEPYMTSVVVGDTVYEVEQGWTAEDGNAAAAPSTCRAPKRSEARNPEADALAQLLLDKLS